MRFLILAFILLASPASAQTLLYKNPCPAPSQTDPAYLAGMQAIIAAIDAGKIISLSMAYPENGQTSHFHVPWVIMKATSNYASGLMPIRPPLNNQAQADGAVGQVVGSADTLGRYVYGDSRSGSSVSTFTCYENAWWAH